MESVDTDPSAGVVDKLAGLLSKQYQQSKGLNNSKDHKDIASGRMVDSDRLMRQLKAQPELVRELIRAKKKIEGSSVLSDAGRRGSKRTKIRKTQRYRPTSQHVLNVVTVSAPPLFPKRE
eukprot:COSAG06_NODE_2162_length_7444_cov_81.420150_10_plen_120_part_00